MKIKIVIIIALVAVFALEPAPAYAKKGFLEALLPGIFGKKDDGPKPEETLVAPFAYEPPPVAEGQKSEESILPLDVAHRGTREIGGWLMHTLSESMTFEGENYQEKMAKTELYFDDVGRREYLTFLQESGIGEVLQTQKYNVRSFVRQAPLLLNEGAVEGRYRWLYEATLMASYMDREMKNYGKKASPVNQMINITIQVGRSKDARGEQEVFIERWTGKMRKLDKK